MQAKKIVVPIDFSTYSDAALRLATTLAKDTGAKLLLVHVEEIPISTGGGDFLYSVPERRTDDLRRQLENLSVPDPTVGCQRFLLTGDPADAVVQLAEEEHADFIVMGTHGRRGLTRILMGSVAEYVMRRATCPVITVKHTPATKTVASRAAATVA